MLVWTARGTKLACTANAAADISLRQMRPNCWLRAGESRGSCIDSTGFGSEFACCCLCAVSQGSAAQLAAASEQALVLICAVRGDSEGAAEVLVIRAVPASDSAVDAAVSAKVTPSAVTPDIRSAASPATVTRLLLFAKALVEASEAAGSKVLSDMQLCVVDVSKLPTLDVLACMRQAGLVTERTVTFSSTGLPRTFCCAPNLANLFLLFFF